MKNRYKGFTLIELLVVISIIAILSVIGIVVFTNVQNNARTTATQATIDAIYKQIEQRRTLENKVVGELTGDSLTGSHWCTDCWCDGRVADWGSPTCLNTLTAGFVTNLGMATLPRDGWGDPILIDENENEPSFSWCRKDRIHSRSHGLLMDIPLSSRSPACCFTGPPCVGNVPP